MKRVLSGRAALCVLATVAGLGAFFSNGAQAAIVVTTGISQGTGVRAQATITDPTSVEPSSGGTLTAVSIKEFDAAILVRDGNISNGIALVKHNLTSAQAWGDGLPNGHTTPPVTNPSGPWNGLVWPYRDQYDYFPNPGDPLGNDVGVPFSSDPGVYGFVNVHGIARGGPTDPAGGGSSPSLLDRGITGNGLNGPATYFNFDIVPLSGDPNRTVTIQIFAASAVVVAIDDSGNYSEVRVPVGDFQTNVQLPEPMGACAFLLLGACGVVRRRRSAAN